VIDRIQLPSKAAEAEPVIKQSQVTIGLNLPSSHVEENDTERRVKVLDLEFFDDLEIVLLAQFDSNFGKSSRSFA
jgi:hypothetical protein